MRSLALVVLLAICSTATATAAPVLVTKDNYKSAADSPFDLAGGGFYLEDFEDGLVNTPGLTLASTPPTADYRIVGLSDGGVSVDIGGKAAETTIVFDDLIDSNQAWMGITFDKSILGALPTQIGFVLTAAEIAPNDLLISIQDGSLKETNLQAGFVASRFVGITDENGISSILLRMKAPLPNQPIFQVDHVQYGLVPEPTSAVLFLLGLITAAITAVRPRPGWRIVRALAACAIATIALAVPLKAVVVFDSSTTGETGSGKRTGVVSVNFPVGSGTLLPTGRHVLTAWHVVYGSNARVRFQTSKGDTEILDNTWERAGPTDDLAIITLKAPAPAEAEVHEIYRSQDEVGKEIEIVGFGQSGTGKTGQTAGTQGKRRKQEIEFQLRCNCHCMPILTWVPIRDLILPKMALA